MARPDVLVLYGADTKAVDKANKALDKSFVSLSKSAARLFGGPAAIAATMAVYTKRTMDAYAETNKWSKALGVSVEQLSAMGYATKSVGISTEQLADQLKDVAEKVADAYVNKGGEAVDALKQLNLSAEDMNKLNPADQLLAIAGGLDEIQSRGQKIQILESLANDATLLLPLLENNAEGMRKLMEEADALGVTLDTNTARNAEKARKALKKLDGVLQGIANTTVSATASAFDKLSLSFRLFGDWWDSEGDESFGSFLERLEQIMLGMDVASNMPTTLPVIEIVGEYEDVEKIAKATDDAAQALERLKQALSGAYAAESQYAESLKILDTALIENLISEKEHIRLVGLATERLGEFYEQSEKAADGTNKLGKEVEKTSDFARDMGLTFESAFEDAVLEGEKLSKVLEGLAQDIARVFLRQTVTNPIGTAATNLFSGFNLGSIFGGARASGGPVYPGKAYLVGERGPELFSPNQAGNITPNGGSVNISQNFDFRGADPNSVMQLRAEAGRIVQQSVAATMAAIEQGGAAARVVGRRA